MVQVRQAFRLSGLNIVRPKFREVKEYACLLKIQATSGESRNALRPLTHG
jgi:hypothetical protein